MKNWKRIAAVVLLLIIGVTGRVLTTSSLGSFPKAQAPAASANTVQQAYDGGHLLVAVGSPRLYGYRIGETIAVTMTIVTDPGTTINIAPFTLGLMPSNSSFELVDKPLLTTITGSDGKTVTTIVMHVRTFQDKAMIQFASLLKYAQGPALNWVTLSTPGLPISTSNTATGSSTQVRDRYLGSTSSSPAIGVLLLRILGGLLLLIPLSWAGLRLFRRLTPVKPRTPGQIFWQSVGEIISHTDESGATADATWQLAHVLRRYLQAESLPAGLGDPNLAEATRAHLEIFFADSEKRFEHARVALETLTALDKALYEKPGQGKPSGLSKGELSQLLAAVERFIPRSERA